MFSPIETKDSCSFFINPTVPKSTAGMLVLSILTSYIQWSFATGAVTHLPESYNLYLQSCEQGGDIRGSFHPASSLDPGLARPG